MGVERDTKTGELTHVYGDVEERQKLKNEIAVVKWWVENERIPTIINYMGPDGKIDYVSRAKGGDQAYEFLRSQFKSEGYKDVIFIECEWVLIEKKGK